jgi:hypothetical protein
MGDFINDALAGICIQIRQGNGRLFAREQQGGRAAYARRPARISATFPESCIAYRLASPPAISAPSIV